MHGLFPSTSGAATRVVCDVTPTTPDQQVAADCAQTAWRSWQGGFLLKRARRQHSKDTEHAKARTAASCFFAQQLRLKQAHMAQDGARYTAQPQDPFRIGSAPSTLAAANPPDTTTLHAATLCQPPLR